MSGSGGRQAGSISTGTIGLTNRIETAKKVYAVSGVLGPACQLMAMPRWIPNLLLFVKRGSLIHEAGGCPRIGLHVISTPLLLSFRAKEAILVLRSRQAPGEI